MSTLRTSLLAVAPLLLFSIACGGATAPLLDANGADSGTTQGAKDAGPAQADGAVGSTPCPKDIALYAGTSCAHEGQTCVGDCSDPCSFCNEIQCVHGVWDTIEISPLPCVPDAGTPRWPDARISWQGPGGVTGLGPAIIVTGDGLVRVWASTAGFDPAALPPTAPTTAVTLTADQVNDLFDRWSRTDISVLPHGSVGSECDAVVEEKACTTCTPTTLSYHDATQLAPEMTQVWSWFTATLAGVDAADTGAYCNP